MNVLPQVDVIVLNWNAGEYLERCLTALNALNYRNFAITLVDNASSDGSLQLVREQFSELRIIANDQNLGYAAGNNVAIRQSKRPYIAIVNPDVFVRPYWLMAHISAMEEDGTIGISGSKLFYPEGSLLQHAGGFINFPRGTTGHYGLHEEDMGQWDQEREVDYVIGAAMVIRRAAINQIGLFDEGYFLYFEDVDLCFRVRRAGFRIVYVPGAAGAHVESATGGKGSALYYRRFHQSRWRFLLVNHDLDAVLRETVPAEVEWISRIGSMERRALFLALRSTMNQMPSIKQSRYLDPTVRAMSENQESAIQSSLVLLRQEARRHGLYSLAELSGTIRGWLGQDKTPGGVD